MIFLSLVHLAPIRSHPPPPRPHRGHLPFHAAARPRHRRPDDRDCGRRRQPILPPPLASASLASRVTVGAIGLVVVDVLSAAPLFPDVRLHWSSSSRPDKRSGRHPCVGSQLGANSIERRAPDLSPIVGDPKEKICEVQPTAMPICLSWGCRAIGLLKSLLRIVAK
ncbi:hypothetical protein PVAP13_8NG073400 [Panicum virgatum]|uniref:Uncharacterized protein n=1 Tax=Panicum virgatum TaxID=38727 RepID=A0A8T0PAJ3_PANVG|nr:hypothetical protein PVAP13_8NG073400 [Panicum virgatum]